MICASFYLPRFISGLIAKTEEAKVKRILKGLLEYFLEHTQEIPEAIRRFPMETRNWLQWIILPE